MLIGRKRIAGMVIAVVVVAGIALAVRSWVPVVIAVLSAVLLRLVMPSVVRQREKDAEWIEKRKRPTPRL